MGAPEGIKAGHAAGDWHSYLLGKDDELETTFRRPGPCYPPLSAALYLPLLSLLPSPHLTTPHLTSCRTHLTRHACRQVRYIGVSNETSYGVSEFSHLAASAGLPKIQTIQNAYSLLVSRAERVGL